MICETHKSNILTALPGAKGARVALRNGLERAT